MSEEKLDQLKREYDAIPIPEGLEFRVKSSIVQAKNAQKEEKPIMKQHHYLKTIFGTCAAAMLTVVVLANSTAGIAHAMEQVPVLGAITRVVTFRTFEEDNGNTAAKIDVPQVEGGGELNDAIKSYTDAIIAEYKRDAAVTEEYAADPDAPDALTNHYAVDLSYTVVTDTEKLFALRFDKSIVMASGTESVMIYNLDKATGKILTLADLFQPDSGYLDVLTKNIQEQMQARMDADESVHYWLNDEVADWNFTALNPDVAFYVNEDGLLTIVFNEGDVAPMYMGVTEFTIPADVTAGIANHDYLN